MIFFYVAFQLSLRGTIGCLMLASIAWVPGMKSIGLDRYAAYMPLAICIYVFTLNPIFGTTVNNAHAGVWGTFLACLNIFMLRGFFSEGVQPGDGAFSTVSLVGWANYLILTFLVLITECRLGFRMFFLASHTGFMLAFLNPADQTPFSKNFKINMNGAAVSSFIGVAAGSIFAILTMLLPYPWRFASWTMKANAVSAAKDTSKLFLGAVNYFKGETATVLIEQLLAKGGVLRSTLDGMGGPVGAAWDESFDIGNAGTVRKLMESQLGMLNIVFDVLQSLMIAMTTEDFGPSHKQCMAEIGGPALTVVEKASVLLIKVSESAADGDISASEKQELTALANESKDAVKALSVKFNETRKKFGKPITKELLSESFFVFAISAYARRVCDYSDMLCTNPPVGDGCAGAITNGLKNTFFPANKYWGRFTTRYYVGLVLCFVYGVHMDNYGGACAITAVFLINTRVGPDMMSTLNVLLAVVVGCVVGAVIFSYSCATAYGMTVLPIVTFLYLWISMFVAFGGSSFALIGLLMAALSPFSMVKKCPTGEVDDGAGALGLWIGIRGCIIAMVIISVFELLSIPGEQARLAYEGWDLAIKQIQQGFEDLWADKSPNEALAPVPGYLGDSATFNTGAKLEPRFARCKWKDAYLTDLISVAAKLRLDILSMRAAMEGADGNTDETVKTLAKVSGFTAIQKDLKATLEDAREIAVLLLSHTEGYFTGMDKLDTLEGIDTVDGLDKAIDSANKIVAFPSTAPDSMEDDMLCQLSIVFVMLDYTVKHIAQIIKCTVQKQV